MTTAIAATYRRCEKLVPRHLSPRRTGSRADRASGNVRFCGFGRRRERALGRHLHRAERAAAQSSRGHRSGHGSNSRSRSLPPLRIQVPSAPREVKSKHSLGRLGDLITTGILTPYDDLLIL